MFFRNIFFIMIAAGLTWNSSASAEVFVLNDGGRLTGDWVNREEKSTKKQYVVQCDDGVRITLDASQVREVKTVRPELAEYEKIVAGFADTVEDQWTIAEWCRERHLVEQREVHLRRILELDADHVGARRALGYAKVGGKWTTDEEKMTASGNVFYKGKWMYPQEVELLKMKTEQEATQKDWVAKVKRWRVWLGTKRDEEARNGLADVTDPAAVPALAAALRDEGNSDIRLLLAESLSHINSRAAGLVLADTVMRDSVYDVRLHCLDYIAQKKYPEVTAFFVSKLRDADNGTIRRAAAALGRLRDPAAIAPLIDALITTHKTKINKAGGNDSISTSFDSSGGGGLSVGGGAKIVTRDIENPEARDALVAITGQNFQYDKVAWKAWLGSQKKMIKFDTRRD